MTDNQYQEFVEFVASQFERMRSHTDQRFDRLEQRTTAVEVGLEAARDERRGMVDLIRVNSDRLGRLEAAVSDNSTRIDRLEGTMAGGFEQIGRRFEQVDQRFEQIDRRFEQVDQRFEQIDQNFDRMEERFDQLETTVGGRLDDHDERIRAVEP